MSDPPHSNGEETTEGSILPRARRILIPDAGVGVKWCVLEDHSAEAKHLLDPRFDLHVPSYFFTEAASVLQRKVAVERTRTEAEGLEDFRRLAAIPMTIHPTEGLLEDAFRLGVRYRRPVYDSLYLVLAASLGGRVVTADRRLYNGVHGDAPRSPRALGGGSVGIISWLKPGKRERPASGTGFRTFARVDNDLVTDRRRERQLDRVRGGRAHPSAPHRFGQVRARRNAEVRQPLVQPADVPVRRADVGRRVEERTAPRVDPAALRDRGGREACPPSSGRRWRRD